MDLKKSTLGAGCILLLVITCGFLMPALCESAASTPQYECQLKEKAILYKGMGDDTQRMGSLTKGSKVTVLSWGVRWSLVKAGGETGYIETQKLYHYRSLDPYTYAIPGYEFQAGMGIALTSVTLSFEGYSGNDIQAGASVVLTTYSPDEATAAIHRTHITLSGGDFRFIPFVPWDAAQPGDLIGGHTTYFNQETGGKLAANRKYNIDLAAQWLDGLTLAPGESFSFNKLCAPYKASKGYKEAPIISSNQAKGYGGGVCQVSTALYNAVLGLPLQITAQSVHRDAGVVYVPVDFDASVGAYSNFTFINTLPYAITISMADQDGVLTVAIYAGEGAYNQYLVIDD